MGRILAIDYGQKRVGIAVSDELQIIATGLTTVETKKCIDFLKEYCSKENVSCFVVGEAKHLNNTPSESAKYIEPFVGLLKKTFPNISVARVDERFTSKMAFQTMIDSGLKKKQRQNKALIDTISATIILQTYMSMSEMGH
ncbi:MAG: Holliday junction resolvase RuvX [Bacteroidales bacterium]|nr:Holliday junction resolvase RuvX [Bacteroidales bacterium]